MIFDEIWASTKVARTERWTRRGKRLLSPTPHYLCQTMTLVAALRYSGMVAPMVLDGPINGIEFQVYVNQIVVPELRADDVVVMDNLGNHRCRCPHVSV